MSKAEEFYDCVKKIRSEVDTLAEAVLKEAPTIELCVFAGGLGAAGAVLDNLLQAGLPVPDPGEEDHPL
jgi:hypothetical protein